MSIFFILAIIAVALVVSFEFSDKDKIIDLVRNAKKSEGKNTTVSKIKWARENFIISDRLAEQIMTPKIHNKIKSIQLG